MDLPQHLSACDNNLNKMNKDLEKTNINVGNRCVHLHSDASNTKSVHSMRTSLPPSPTCHREEK